MDLLILSSSISRVGGGLYDAVRNPARILTGYPNTHVRIFSLLDEYSNVDIDTWLPLKPEVYSYKFHKGFGFAPSLKKKLGKISPPDILHIHGLWMYQGIVSLKFCCKNKIPYLISPHGMLDNWALKNSRWKKILAGIFYENRNLHGAFCLHALNKAEFRAIRKYGLKNPVCLIPNGIEVPDYKESFEPPWANVVGSGKKVLLFLGRIHPKKGLTALLEAWGHLIRDDVSSMKGWNLVIVGWDQERHEEELQRTYKSLLLGKSVHFLGPLYGKQKTAAYQNSDAFILPSLSEGLPMTILEAWSHKLPVLMTPQCNIPEGFAADAAIEIQPSRQAIVKGLLKLFDMSSSDLNQMGNNGFFLVGEKFSWETIAAELFSVYNWIVGGGATPSCVMKN